MSFIEKIRTAGNHRLFRAIPKERGYNALENQRLKNELSAFQKSLYDKKSPLYAELHSYWKPYGALITNSIKSAFSKISLKDGDTVYNPFGGFDPTAFLISGKIRHAFIMSKELFGSPEDLVGFFKNAEPSEKLNHRFLRHDDLSSLSPGNIWGIKYGLGGMLLGRIMAFFDWNISGIYYFETDNGGLPRFLKYNDIQSYTGLNSAIFFQNKFGGIKSFWHLHNDTNSNSPNFIKFINRLDFQTLLLKGCMLHFLERARQDVVDGSIGAIKYDPDITVITDSADPKIELPQDIWKKRCSSNFVEARSGFGYGYRIYHGTLKHIKKEYISTSEKFFSRI